MLAKPNQAHEDGESVDESQVGQGWNKVNVELLICVQVLDINTEMREGCDLDPD